MKYEVIIYWSEDDQAFIAEVPELPGCAADGPTKRHWRTSSRSPGSRSKRLSPLAVRSRSRKAASCSREVAIAEQS